MTAFILLHAASATALLLVGALAIAARRRRAWNHARLGRIYQVLLVVGLGSGLVVGARDPALSVFEIVTPPTYAMGLLGYLAARRRRPFLGRPWVFWHIQGVGGSYICVVTATLFQILPRLLPGSLVLMLAIGLLPTII